MDPSPFLSSRHNPTKLHILHFWNILYCLFATLPISATIALPAIIPIINPRVLCSPFFSKWVCHTTNVVDFSSAFHMSQFSEISTLDKHHGLARSKYLQSHQHTYIAFYELCLYARWCLHWIVQNRNCQASWNSQYFQYLASCSLTGETLEYTV